jgi:nicotinamide-nucleotide adenylyltransferase
VTRRSLYIGRFQIFHLGHLDVVRYMAEAPDIDEIMLVIGSTQYDHHRRSPVASWEMNPFTVQERMMMIQSSLQAAALPKPFRIELVPDYHDWERWYGHIVRHVPKFLRLYSADRKEREFFGNKGHEVTDFPKHRDFHAGALRRLLATGEEGWRACVPDETADVLSQIGAAKRCRDMLQKDRDESQIA